MTKCDTIVSGHVRGMEGEKEITRKQLEAWGIGNVRIMATSAMGGFDNDNVRSLIQ